MVLWLWLLLLLLLVVVAHLLLVLAARSVAGLRARGHFALLGRAAVRRLAVLGHRALGDHAKGNCALLVVIIVFGARRFDFVGFGWRSGFGLVLGS